MKPWLNMSILKKIRKKNQAYKKWIAVKDIITWQKYTHLKKETSNQIITAKKLYHQQHLHKYCKDLKRFWKYLNTVIGKNSKATKIPYIKTESEKLNDFRDMSNYMNDFFCTVAQKLDNELPPRTNNDDSQDLSYFNPYSLYLKEISQSEVLKVINSLPNKQSTGGLDSANAIQIKWVADLISAPLADLFNCCISQGHFPVILKVSKVMPIYKSGNNTDVNNYRPIALQSTFAKIFEKLLKVRFTSFIKKYKILNVNQYGFREKSSTSMAILDLIQTIETNRDMNQHTVALFLDLSKAFDTVRHQILLRKLEHYGFRGITLQLITSYLTNRYQYTVVNGETSHLQTIQYGVPQGSILGPLLFLIYINDINQNIQVDFKMFADDTVILITHYDVKVLQEMSNIAIKDTHSWLIRNRLTLNAKKTVYLFFNAKKKFLKVDPPKIFIDNLEIIPSLSTKYLGFVIDHTLSCKLHIYSLILKVNKCIGIFHKVSELTTYKTKFLLYHTILYPHLIYCIEIYGNAGSSAISELQIAQNKAIRALFKLHKFSSTSEIYEKLGISKIKEIYNSRAKILLDKIINEQEKFLNIHTKFLKHNPQLSHKYETRGKSCINLTFNSQSYTSSIVYNLFLLWNANQANK
jgi:hypothetical protein